MIAVVGSRDAIALFFLLIELYIQGNVDRASICKDFYPIIPCLHGYNVYTAVRTKTVYA